MKKETHIRELGIEKDEVEKSPWRQVMHSVTAAVAAAFYFDHYVTTLTKQKTSSLPVAITITNLISEST